MRNFNHLRSFESNANPAFLILSPGKLKNEQTNRGLDEVLDEALRLFITSEEIPREKKEEKLNRTDEERVMQRCILLAQLRSNSGSIVLEALPADDTTRQYRIRGR